jgi:hypothetical protein
MTDRIGEFEIRVAPDEIDAGAELTLEARLTTSADLTGRLIDIADAEGRPAGTLAIARFDGEVNATDQMPVMAPSVPGRHGWTATLRPEGDAPPLVHAFEVQVRAHAPTLMVWDLPGVVEAGARVTAKLGLKCRHGCDLAGRAFEIRDADGETRATGRFSGAIWPGTEGLLQAEVPLDAPEAEGLHRWQVRVAADPGDRLHGAAAAELRLRTGPPADCTLRIEAVCAEEEAPLAGASVVLHPYRARTDARGIAEIRVPRGLYKVFVSGPGRYPVSREIEITADLTERAPLQAEPPPSKDW